MGTAQLTNELGSIEVKPSSDCRNYKPPASVIDPAASLRDSENWFFDYDSVNDQVAGITLPRELASWFKKAGFRKVKEVTNVYFTSLISTSGLEVFIWGQGRFKVPSGRALPEKDF